MSARTLRSASFGLVVCAFAACGVSADQRWQEAQDRWQRREPGAWAAWTEAARGSDEAKTRLQEADVLYRRGVVALEEGEAGATEVLRQGARIAPIDPRLYLRLARACRAQGAVLRAVDFYRKYVAETPAGAERSAAERELMQIAQDVGDPFTPTSSVETPRVAFIGLALALLTLGLWAARRRGARVEAILRQHPERASAFTYFAGVLRHELLKHRLAPMRSGEAQPPPLDPLMAAWHRHVDMLAAALGVSRARLLGEPVLCAADRAMGVLGRAEAQGRSSGGSARDALVALDRALVRWAQLVERTSVDDALLERLVESLRDERPGRRLAVQVELAPGPASLTAMVLSNDLLLVLRNLVRNAITAAEAVGALRVRIERRAYLDETGQEWAQVIIHDPSPDRPPVDRPSDRGLGLVRATLDRYGGALLELEPAPGYEKALGVSLPRADEDPAVAIDRVRAAA